MGGRHFEPVRQARELIADAVVELVCQRHLGIFAQEIGAAQRPDEQEVAAQEDLRHLCRPRHLVHEERHMLRGVPRRVNRFEAHCAELRGLSVLDRSVLVLTVVQLPLVVGRQQQLGARSRG